MVRRGLGVLDATEGPVHSARAYCSAGFAHRFPEADLVLEARRIGVRTLQLMDESGSVVHVTHAGSASFDPGADLIPEFLEQCAVRVPHDDNVKKLQRRMDLDGQAQRHLVVLIGSRTEMEHPDLAFALMHKHAEVPTPRRNPDLPECVTDAWVICTDTEWAAWWSRGRGWVV